MSYENIGIQGPSQTTLCCIKLSKLFFLPFESFVSKMCFNRPPLLGKYLKNKLIAAILPSTISIRLSFAVSAMDKFNT